MKEYFKYSLLFLCANIVFAAPSRVVTLTPEITETVAYLLDKNQNRLVGRSSFSDFPDWVKSRPIISDFSSIYFEKLVTLKPDLLIGMKDGAFKINQNKIEKLKIPVSIASYNSIETYLNWILTLGNDLDLTIESKKLVDHLKYGISEIKSKSKTTGIKALLVLTMDPLMVVGGGNYLDSYLDLLSVQNVGKSWGNGFVTVNREVLAQTEIDQIIVFEKLKTNIPTLHTKAKWTWLGTSDSLLRLSPRMLQGISLLKEALLK